MHRMRTTRNELSALVSDVLLLWRNNRTYSLSVPR